MYRLAQLTFVKHLHQTAVATQINPWNLGWVAANARSSSTYLGDSLSTNIETVKLSYDRHQPATPSNKSPLIFLHGLFGSKLNNRTVAKQLVEILNRDVYCLDLRNFGQSPHINRLDYPSLAADVEKFIDDAEFVEKPILIGHSMGAKTAMALALRRPELPRFIVSVDNAPVDLSNNNIGVYSKYVRQLIKALDNQQFTSIKDVDLELLKVEPTKEIRQFLLTNINRGRKDEKCTLKIPLKLIGDSITAGNIAAWPYDHNISRWSKGPALFIRGTESNYVPDEVIPDIGNYFPSFELRDVKAGHWLISENPKDFIETLVDFIEKHEDI